jgi:hypothetical protein
VRNRICKAIVIGATALSLAASALATAEPGAAQWRGEHDGDYWGPLGRAGASDPYFASPWDPSDEVPSAPDWGDDSCWQVRPIYSASGAWLDNRRVNVCR